MTVNWITFYGIFSIDKRDIIQNTVEHYKRFLELVNTHSNPEAGHYIERSWSAIFHPLNYTELKEHNNVGFKLYNINNMYFMYYTIYIFMIIISLIHLEIKLQNRPHICRQLLQTSS
jgi:hypothetical protein